MLLLGYGLVELPRSLWRRADLAMAARLAAVSAVDRYYTASDTKLELQSAIAELLGRYESTLPSCAAVDYVCSTGLYLVLPAEG